jgi:LSD1 subclass zinc finger protein
MWGKRDRVGSSRQQSPGSVDALRTSQVMEAHLQHRVLLFLRDAFRLLLAAFCRKLLMLQQGPSAVPAASCFLVQS